MLAKVKTCTLRLGGLPGCTLGSLSMVAYLSTWLALSADRRAVTFVEYGVIAGIIVVVLMASFGILGSSLSGKFSSIGTSI